MFKYKNGEDLAYSIFLIGITFSAITLTICIVLGIAGVIGV